MTPRSAGYRAFELFHPAVPALLFAGAVGVAMAGIEPRLAAITLAGAACYSLLTIGPARALSKLRYQLPLLALICLINPLFSAMGSTLLGKVGPFRIYAESLAYGAVMGALLVAVLMWIEAAAESMGSDELMTLTGGALPYVTLALSMVMRLIPQLVSRTASSRDARSATTVASEPPGAVEQAASSMNRMVAWALEDSVEKADSMRARGWGSARRRSSYRIRRLRRRDIVATAGIGLAIAGAAFGAHRALTSWVFYPRMEGAAPWPAYLACALLAFLPSVFALVSAAERRR